MIKVNLLLKLKICRICNFTGEFALFKCKKCKSCVNKEQKEFNFKHKDIINNKQRENYKNNKQSFILKNKRYVDNNKEKVAIRQKEYYKNNKEKICLYLKKYHKTYKPKIDEEKKRINQRKWSKNKRDTDPVFKLRQVVSLSVNKALKAKNSNKNGHSILNNLNYSILDLKSHLESLFEPWMNWENWGKYNKEFWDDNDQSTWTWHIDHIIPKSLFSYISMTDEDFNKCWALKNLRPLNAKANVLEGKRKICQIF